MFHSQLFASSQNEAMLVNKYKANMLSLKEKD